MRRKTFSLLTIGLLLTTICFFLFIPSITADDYVFGTNIQINDDDSTADQKTPDIAITDNGNVYIVWTDERNGNPDIFISESTDGGRLFGDGTPDSDKRVDNDVGATQQINPAIATYGNDIYVIWSDDRSGYYHIYFAKSTNGGDTFTGYKKVDNSDSTATLQYSDIAIDSNGKICIVWQEFFLLDYDIYYVESDDDGVSFSANVHVDSGPGLSAQKYPKIAIGSQNHKYIVWQDNRSGGINYDIYFTHAASTSSAFTSNEIRVDDTGVGTSSQNRPCIAAYGASTVYLAWKDERTTAAGDIYFDKSTTNGMSWGADKKIDDASAGTPVQDWPAMAVDDGGVIHMVWEDRRTSRSVRATYPRIYYSNSTDGGSEFSDNVQVDDSPNQEVNREEPVIAARKSNELYLAWKDKRNGNSDIYFSKWGIAGQMGYPPYLSGGIVKDQIGGVNESFIYSVVYTDVDNEAPAAGYPKVYIYTDHLKTGQLSGSPFTMTEKFGQDPNYSDGMIYSYTKKLTEDYDYTFLIEAKASTGDTSVVSSELMFGPKMDTTPPIFFNPIPSSKEWQNSVEVECGITIADPGGTGIDQTTIQYQYRTNGTSTWDKRFYANAIVNPVGNDFICKAVITCKEGAENYIRWNATDMVKSGANGYNISEAYEIKVDTTPVTFTNPIPPGENVQNKEIVTCSITINDFGGSGINTSSINYWYKKSTLSTIAGPFSAKTTESGESITITTPEIQLENGNDNYIKWSAMDIAGNNKMSNEYPSRINTSRPDNTPPEAPTTITPSETKDSTPYIEWDEGYDSDLNELKYQIQIGTYYDGNDVIKWTSTGTNTYYTVTDNLAGDTTYFIQVRVHDGWDYSPTLQSMLLITITGNEPPKAPSAIFPNVTSSHTPEITWTGASDPENDTLNYRIQIGTDPSTSDILSFLDLGQKNYYTPPSLTDGIYYVQVMAMDGTGSSSPHEETLKIASFQIEFDIENSVTVNKGVVKSFEFSLTNNCSMEDNVTIDLSGDLTTETEVSLTLSPAVQINFKPYETKKITLKIYLPLHLKVGQHTFELQTTSEDGETQSMSHTLFVEVVGGDTDGDGLPDNWEEKHFGNLAQGPGDDYDNDGISNLNEYQDGSNPTKKESSDSDNGSMLSDFMPILIFLIIIIVVIVILVAVASASSKKKRAKKDQEDFFRKEGEYEDLYGQKKY